MHYGAMTLQDYGQVRALCAGQAGVLIRDADSPEHFARYLQRNPGLSFVPRDGEALAGCILCGHDGRRGYLNHLVVEESHRRLGVGRRRGTVRRAEYFQKRQPAAEGRMGCVSNA